MTRRCARFFQLGLPIFLLIGYRSQTWGAEARVEIRSPKDGTNITQEQNYIMVSGKVASGAARSPLVDIILALDVSASTALYAGVDFSEFSQLPNFYVRSGCLHPGRYNLRNSILAAEIVTSRRLLSQLDPATTRVGVITFATEVWLRQPLTHNFEEVRQALDLIYKRGPFGGTNMVDAIGVATEELLGKGESEKYLDSIKTVLFLTDGFPTLPSGNCRSGKQADEDLTISAARKAGTAGINVHVFALGEEALSNPRAAVGMAKESGGTYTAVTRPADVLAVVDKISAVGVDSIQVTNDTIQQKALQSRLAVDGFFASAVPVVEGLNRIQVLCRASDGSIGRDTITVHYQPGGNRSLDLEVFLEREKNLKLQVERLGKSSDQIQADIDRHRAEGVKQSPMGEVP
jgi:hypothetical protein